MLTEYGCAQPVVWKMVAASFLPSSLCFLLEIFISNVLFLMAGSVFTCMNPWPRCAGPVPSRLSEWARRKHWCTCGHLHAQICSACASSQFISGTGVFQVRTYSHRRCESDLYEKLVLFVLRLAFPFCLKSFMDGYSWKWIFEPSAKKWRSIARLLLRALEWASYVVKSTPTASLFSSSLSPRQLNCFNRTLR